MTRIAYLIKRGRKARLAQGEFPTELFYGFPELREAGESVDLLEEEDLGLDRVISRLWDECSRRAYAFTGIHLWAVSRFLTPDVLRRLNRYDLLIATTTVFGTALAALKRLGRLQPRVVIIAMGLGGHDRWSGQRRLTRWLLRDIELAVISRSEAACLQRLCDPQTKVGYVPFGVDHAYWIPASEQRQEDYILSIGNDWHRDYDTLVAAWQPTFPHLKIVTRLPVSRGPANVEVIPGDWQQQLLSDADVRRLIQHSRFVVIPLRETIQPSGQSACLQAMACGKAVILSEIRGLWDRARMVHEHNCVLVRPGSVEQLRAAVQTLLEHPQRAQEIGRQARHAIEEHFNVQVMAQSLRAFLGLSRPPHAVACPAEVPAA